MFCRHVFGNISGGFRAISRLFGNFAGFRGNTWISRVRDHAKYQKPWLEKSKKAVSLLRVVSSPEQYVCFFNFNFELFSYLLSFSYRFYLPCFLDLANCVSDQAEFCSREGMRAIVKKYLYPVHKNKLDLRDLFS